MTRKVVVDNTLCRNYGICAGIQPEIFVIPPGSPFPVIGREIVEDDDLEEVREAARSCPAQAITIVES
ncbi:ferredoxin [Nonomuraea wenchangensis]|uniref:Ferredoxin n=1 Tax=Nonomuraea wenchangensis TaxID=568860 RepID=A0A1I0L1F6_9ACTN|nr:ferredoxin [Nonomuraea wenchangensis]SEU32799.1 Ferredoxin [Nonomuraea wenchangensis]